jgi:multiple sugar transport system permease protein
MNLWFVGGQVIVYLAALQGVPQHLLEAAQIDGAGPLRRFKDITIPMISPAILFNVVLSLIYSFQFFTQPFVLLGGQIGAASSTFGGPLQSALFYSPYVWENGFSYFKMGYASALSWILFAIIMILTLGVLRLSRRSVYYEESA